MKALTFIAIALLSGAISGTILGILNQIVVEPFVARAIAIEQKNMQESGVMINPLEFASYRIWQRGGEIAAGTILGLSFGAVFGLVYAYARPHMSGKSDLRRSLFLSSILWLTLFLLPALKYPANPPAVGDPETIYFRQALYLGFISITGFSAIGLGVLYAKFKDNPRIKYIVPSAFAAIVASAFLLMPPNPDAITAPMDLVLGFRIASAATMTIFWMLLGLVMGFFWDRLKPHETARLRLH